MIPTALLTAFGICIGCKGYARITRAASGDGAGAECCRVPEFAKVIGHEEMWKRHNNCL